MEDGSKTSLVERHVAASKEEASQEHVMNEEGRARTP